MKIKFAKVLQLAPLETDHRPVYNQQGGHAPHLQDTAIKWPPTAPTEASSTTTLVLLNV